MNIFSRIIVLAAIFAMAIPVCAKDTALIYRDSLNAENKTLVDAITEQISSAGYEITNIDTDGLCSEKVLDPSTVDLLVIPDGTMLPARACTSIEAYLKAGGDIIALQAPMWQKSLIKIGGKWTTKDEYGQEHASDIPENPIAALTADDISNWKRSTDNADNPTKIESSNDSPVKGHSSLHVTIPKLTSYDTLYSPDMDTPFAGGKILTVFSAKGGESTSALAIEWTEKDGSRWIATVPLFKEWRKYILTPEDFKFWQSNPSRGFQGDSFKPENAVRICFGEAFTHTGGVSGQQEYWVSMIGTSVMLPELDDFAKGASIPKLDTLSPSYKFFNTSSAVQISSTGELNTTAFEPLKVTADMRSPQPRPGGGGFDKGRDWRWIPLLEAKSGNGEWRGNPLTCTVHADGPYKGGVWVSSGITDPKIYTDPSVLRLIKETAVRMKQGLFILDGGSNFYTYFADQSIRMGARIVNLSKEERSDVPVILSLLDSKTKTNAFSKQITITVLPGQTVNVSELYTPASWPQTGMTASAMLIYNGVPIDRVSNSVDVWKPKAKKNFITVKNGQFFYKGKRWKAHGINYMPSSGIGTEDGPYFEYWMGARSYDPVIIDRDLDHLKALGINSVSIFIYSDYTEHQNLLDILQRLDRHGMKANVSLRPGTPMDFYWDKISKIINYYKLWENDTVYAYDLAWEPSFGSHEERQMWDGEWEKWVVERYGSIANAERDWGYSIPRNSDGTVTNPKASEIDTNGKWKQMTAAYRRFLDTLLYQKYSSARRLVRSIDPNHLVSFRMSDAANPTFRWDGRITYDFPYLAAAVDFLAPEAYGRIGDWERVKPGWFEWKYAKWAAPEKPCIWAEMGVSSWDISIMENPKSKLEYQAMFYKNFYRLLHATGTDGIYFWWYPGGFRVGENSDFGIINPDGSDKPVTPVIRKNAKEFLKDVKIPGKPVAIMFDRDRYPDGIAGVYDDHQEEFWKYISKGMNPRLITAGTGTTSVNCPLIAVGNTKCNGSNPPKYLDAAIDTVEIQNPDGQWTMVEKGGEIVTDNAVKARVTITNLGEAALIAPSASYKPGTVYMTISSRSGIKLMPLPASLRKQHTITINDVTIPANAKVTIGLTAKNRISFGERYTFITKQP